MLQQWTLAVKKTYRVPGFVGRSVAGGSQEIIISLYSALARLHLEHCVGFWGAHYKKDVDILQWVWSGVWSSGLAGGEAQRRGFVQPGEERGRVQTWPLSTAACWRTRRRWSQTCLGGAWEWEAIDTTWKFPLNKRLLFFFFVLWGWSGTETGWPEKLSNFLTCSRVSWTSHWLNWFN